jgi:hypothetical protein
MQKIIVSMFSEMPVGWDKRINLERGSPGKDAEWSSAVSPWDRP